ncbi:MAG: hypothetical protein HYX75_15120 [Acidobacteria bacterium]|nr:hypothetical protein [Acidobacteriota bacterium]
MSTNKTVRRHEVRARLTDEEYGAVAHLAQESGLSQADVLRRLVLTHSKRKWERAAAGEIEQMTTDVEALSKRVEALHSRLGGVEHGLMAGIETLSKDIVIARNAALEVQAARGGSGKTAQAIEAGIQDLSAAVRELIRIDSLTALRVQAVVDLHPSETVRQRFGQLVEQVRAQGGEV